MPGVLSPCNTLSREKRQGVSLARFYTPGTSPSLVTAVESQTQRTEMSKIIPIRDVMPIGRPADPPPAARAPCGANTPVTWGELYLLFVEARQAGLADAVFAKIIALDGAPAPAA